MPSPTPLAVATASIQRLVKEESFYHKELEGQKTRVANLEQTIAAGTDDKNAEYVLRQEVGYIFSLMSLTTYPSPPLYLISQPISSFTSMFFLTCKENRELVTNMETENSNGRDRSRLRPAAQAYRRGGG
jgi:hypothetical protein